MKRQIKLTMKTTALVTTILIICLGIYDLAAVVVGSEAVSVSTFLINAGLNRPFIVFAFGFVAGHLFGRMDAIDPKTGELR